MVLDAQSAKALAVVDLESGNIKDASDRLKGTAAKLRRDASLIPVTDEKSANSLAIVIAEADVIDALAETAETETVFYSQKRMTESFSRKTRSRNVRNDSNDTNTTSLEEIN